MAIVSGTVQSHTSGFGAGGSMREDLSDVIYDLFPMETWAFSNLQRTKAKATNHEWLYDALAATATNRQIEGDETSFSAPTAPTRLGNYTQIVKKSFLISGTYEAVDKAGRKSELTRQAMKQMKELKRDIEAALVGAQASSAGGTATARSMGSMESWIATTDNGGNGQRSTTTASASTAAYSSGVTAPTDGTTTGALTETVFQRALGDAWADGGDPRIVLMPRVAKAYFNAFTGVATKYQEQAKAKQADILGAADYYVSDFGQHTVVLHRYMRTSVIICCDPDYWGVATLRGPFMEELAKTGDAEKRQIIWEGTLECRNPNASAKVVAIA